MAQLTRTGALSGMAAALAMTISPIAASAAEMPSVPAPQSFTSDLPMPGVFESEEIAENHRRWRGYRGYRGYRHRHRGIDAGDVFAGVLILGGIAAIASAANKDKRERDRDYRYRDRDYRDRDYDYRPRRGDSRYQGGRGIDNAVNMCVDRIERDVRVDSVDSVDRTGAGWLVTGALYDGERFSCRIGADGRIDGVDYGGGSSDASFSGAFPAEGQWSDSRYAEARRSAGAPAPQVASSAATADPQPAYPGGPLPGEELPESDGDDGRYSTADAPDFTG